MNGKVIVALAVVGLGLWAFAPGVAVAALPLLVLGACPLSMVLMMRALGSGGNASLTGRNPSTAPAAGSPGSDEVAALRAEIAELRRERSSDDAGRSV